jgi:SAM-dependent methyltransferase
VADEEALPLKDSSLDLIASALSLHVVNDLPGALVQIRRALRPDGLFIGALLGGDTLIELRHAFAIAESEILGGVSPRVFPTASLQDTGGLLQRAGFALPVSDSEKVTVTYASPLALMNDLRSMGASNSLLQRSRRPLRRDVLARAAGVYSDLYGGGGKVAATFEVLYLSGWAPHASQQKPLKPGSAAMRLSDALNSTDLSAGDKASFRREPPAPEKGS